MTIGQAIRRRILEAIIPSDALEGAGGLPWESIYPAAPPPAILAPARPPQRFRTLSGAAFPSAIGKPIPIAEDNPARRALTIVNFTDSTLQVMLGYGATIQRFTYSLVPFYGTLILEGPDVYQGVITGALSGGVGSGTINVTEL